LPQSLRDLLAGYQFATALHQQEEEIHRMRFESQDGARAAQFVTREVELQFTRDQ
jgi:hypothetical protein